MGYLELKPKLCLHPSVHWLAFLCWQCWGEVWRCMSVQGNLEREAYPVVGLLSVVSTSKQHLQAAFDVWEPEQPSLAPPPKRAQHASLYVLTASGVVHPEGGVSSEPVGQPLCSSLILGLTAQHRPWVFTPGGSSHPGWWAVREGEWLQTCHGSCRHSRFCIWPCKQVVWRGVSTEALQQMSKLVYFPL